MEAKKISDLSLFNLTGEFLSLFETEYPEIYEEDSDEVKAEKEAEQAKFDDALSEIITAMDSKADGYCFVRARLLADIDTAKAEKKRIDSFIERKKRAIERMEKRLYEAMKETGRTNIETAIHTISIKPKRASVQILKDIEDIPEEYRRTKVEIEPDKTKIRDAIKSGKTFDFAVYESTGDELKIK